MHVGRRVGGLEGAGVFAARAGHARAAGTAAEHHRAGRSVEFGNGHHDGALDRQQTAFRAAPLIQRLELQGVGREIGHVQRGEHILGSLGIVVSRTTHQGEACQRHQCVDPHNAVLNEKLIDRGTRIESRCKGRNHAQAARLEGRNHAIVVPGVTGQQVGAQHEHADGALRPGREGHVLDLLAIAALHPRVIHAHFRIGHRLGDFRR